MNTTKEKLMQSALELFKENGFDNTPTASIAKHAGFATGTLFVHFKSKNDLLESMYISIKKESHSYVFGSLNNSVSSGEKLRETYRKTFEYYVKNYEKLIFIEQFTNSSYMSRIDFKDLGNEMEEYLEILDTAKQEGVIADRSNDLLYITIGGLFFSLSKYLQQNGEDKIDECVEIIMNALQ